MQRLLGSTLYNIHTSYCTQTRMSYGLYFKLVLGFSLVVRYLYYVSIHVYQEVTIDFLLACQ